jgi:hypothetical protein
MKCPFRDTRVLKGIFDSLKRQNLNQLKEENVMNKANHYLGKFTSDIFDNDHIKNEKVFEDFEEIFDLLLEYPNIFEKNFNKLDPLFFKMVDLFIPSYDEILFQNNYRSQNKKFNILSLEWSKNTFGFIR